MRPLIVPPARYRAGLARRCALADILRLSKDDLDLLCPGVPAAHACDQWHAAGARLVVVTLGGRGALIPLTACTPSRPFLSSRRGIGVPVSLQAYHSYRQPLA